ncbi:SLC2A4 regulator isoform X5 [Myotis daubentonii]|uniref:SLC2A4 regulator isoform X5 n=1 Tax=Myotis daubentonii TaxID=98922 RepID=UPI00287397CD|nr:SLC2A4 regulator isoform X5 [Myotis daubentonii]
MSARRGGVQGGGACRRLGAERHGRRPIQGGGRRPGPGPRPERPPSPLQPRRPVGGPWKPSAAWRLAGAAGTLLPAPPVRNPWPRPCRCPRRRRAPQGKVQLDEVMAAAALTSLSTSPLLLRPPAAALSTDACLEPWPQTLGQPPGSYSSSSSGDWGWDPASEQSCPSSPSPPLPPEAAFLFGEPAPQKRKSSGQVLFQCLWKRCGKVLSTASGMQRHIRLVHLGRQAEPEQSDGEEDFYYTELGIGLEVLSPAAPPQVCHNDHSYQGCLASTELQPQPSTVRACVPAVPAKLSANLRKPRGDAKKCRKVYGTERRDLWCTACRWKKACQRFLD